MAKPYDPREMDNTTSNPEIVKKKSFVNFVQKHWIGLILVCVLLFMVFFGNLRSVGNVGNVGSAGSVGSVGSAVNLDDTYDLLNTQSLTPEFKQLLKFSV
jgi:hypothetical protein